MCEEEALLVTHQVLDALAYLERSEVIHRDLKPENIMFRSDRLEDGVAIIDFGFATEKKRYKDLFARCGTPGFVAPEVYGDEDYDYRIDVFSLGILFYIMLIAKNPFAGTYKEVLILNLKCEISFDFESKGIKLSPLGRRE